MGVRNRSALVALMLVAACAISLSPGEGEKIGQVVKLSKVGLFSKTWEGQLIRGGMNGGSGSFGTTPFDFTVEGDSLVSLVTKYMQDQTEVVIKYRHEGVWSCFRSQAADGDGTFLISITPAPKDTTKRQN